MTAPKKLTEYELAAVAAPVLLGYQFTDPQAFTKAAARLRHVEARLEAAERLLSEDASVFSLQMFAWDKGDSRRDDVLKRAATIRAFLSEAQ